MKNKIPWIIIAIITVLAAVVIYDAKKYKWLEKTPENTLSMSVSSVSQSDIFFNIKAEYPQFKDIDPAFNQKINSKISDLINGEISDFKKEATDNWQTRKDTATPEYPVPENPEQPFDFIATWTPTQLNDKYISFTIDIYYFSGGAHGNDEIFTFNYDILKNKEITILDFLNNSQENLNKVSELAVKDINFQLLSKGLQADDSLAEMIKDGTKPTIENFKNFNFNKNALIIYFQKYQVAPGVVGEITTSLYKEVLEAEFVKSDYFN